MKTFKLDKSCGKAGKFEDFDYNRRYWLNKRIAERLQGAWFLRTEQITWGNPVTSNKRFTPKKYE